MIRLAACLLLGLTACSSLTNYESQSYVVGSGDTLYSIAWSHGVNHQDLARWNNLSNPDRIYVGQRLALSAEGRAAPGVRRGAPVPATARSSGSGSASRSASASGSASASASGSASGSTSASAPARAPNANRPPFAWPTRGAIVARFGERGILSTGIGISGSAGQDVLAAAPGRVVYVGGGLPEYGQVVIIKHNESWLTAYGYNRRLLVTQEQTVARGQKIGEMGLGPGRLPRLYFEIRRDGDPLDPLGLLPSSG